LWCSGAGGRHKEGGATSLVQVRCLGMHRSGGNCWEVFNRTRPPRSCIRAQAPAAAELETTAEPSSKRVEGSSAPAGRGRSGPSQHACRLQVNRFPTAFARWGFSSRSSFFGLAGPVDLFSSDRERKREEGKGEGKE
ncbi:unnamed protein product, partial [Prorocentrum cordatum]